MLGVSFVIPVYNKAPYLPMVIEALLNQTGTFEREYIFVNDGSTDQSMQIIREMMKDVPDVIYIDQHNQGNAIATNNGILAAKYRYIKFLDADDVLAPYATELLFETARKFNATFIFGKRKRFDHTQPIDWDQYKVTPFKYRFIKSPMRRTFKTILSNPSGMLIRRQELISGGLLLPHNPCSDVSLQHTVCRLGQFVGVNQVVVLIPNDVPDRLGNSKRKELMHHTQITKHFLGQHPDLTLYDQHLAVLHSARRALKYFSKKRDQKMYKMLWIYLRALYPKQMDYKHYLDLIIKSYE